MAIKAILDEADNNAKTNYEQHAKSASNIIVAELVVEILNKI